MSWRSERRARRGTVAAPHVLVIVQNLSVPFDRRVWMECRTLVGAGYRVSVICPRAPGDAPFEVLEGVRIHRYPEPPPATGVAGFVRECAWAWLHTLVRSAAIYARRPFDVIQACNPPDTYFALARLYRPFGVAFVYDQHDLCPEIFRSRFGDRRGPGLRLLLALERATYAAADTVIATNASYRRIACARGDRTVEDVTIVRSGPDPAVMRPGPAVPELRHGRRHLCCYLGVMGHQDRVDLLLRAIDRYVHDLGRQDCHFTLMGFGDCLESLRALCHELGLDDWVTFTGRADLPTIAAHLSTASIGLAPDPASPFNDVSTMNKVVEYLAYALPVVSFDLHETAVTLGGAGVLVPDDDVAAFAGAVAALLDDDDRRARLGALGRRRVVEELGWPTQADAYRRVFDQLTGGVPVHAATGMVPA